MADMIDRQAAIDALNEVSEHYTEKGREWHPHVDFMIDAIKDLPPAQSEQRWISVKERMPEERDSIFKERYGTDRWRNTMFLKTSDNVLATVVDNNGNYTVVPACTIDGRWSICKNLHRKVVAWQQYPEPYKEEQDD